MHINTITVQLAKNVIDNVPTTSFLSKAAGVEVGVIITGVLDGASIILEMQAPDQTWGPVGGEGNEFTSAGLYSFRAFELNYRLRLIDVTAETNVSAWATGLIV